MDKKTHDQQLSTEASNFLIEHPKELVDKGISVSQHLSIEVEDNEIKLIYSFFNPCSWYELGRVLGIANHTLDPLRKDADNENQRLFKVFDVWRKNDNATYLNLLAALSLSSELKLIIPEILDYLAKKFKTERPKPAIVADSNNDEEPNTERQSQGDSSDTSEYQSQHSFPEFVCGCGACTLKDYLKDGCPKAGKLQHYPKLDVKNLSLEEQEILLLRLDEEVTAVQEQFGSLTCDVVGSLEVPVGKLTLYLSAFTTFRPNDSCLLCDAKAELLGAKTVLDLFNVLKQYWSWINYELLEKIIHKFGDHETNERLEIYKEQTLEPFLKRSVIEIPSNAYGHSDIPHYKKVTFKLGTDMESHSASSLRLIRRKLATILGIDVTSLHISTVTDGCMEICFLVPKVVVDFIFNLQKDSLKYMLAGFEIDGKPCKVKQLRSSAFVYNLSGEPLITKVNANEPIPLSAIPEHLSRLDSLKEEDANNIFPMQQPFCLKRQISLEDDKSCISVLTKSQSPQSVSLTAASSGYHTLSDKAALTDLTDLTDNASMIMTTADTSSVSSRQNRKPYLGVAFVCKTCWEMHKRDKLLDELQCMQLTNHERAPYIHVTWNKAIMQWINIQKQPDYIPKQKYLVCTNASCPGESCINAHGNLELRAWNHELHKQKRMDTYYASQPLIYRPGERSKTPQSHWKARFDDRLRRSKLEKQKDIPLTQENYKDKFYNLLCFEEMEHIDTLSKRCDGKFKLHIYKENPDFLTLESYGTKSDVVYGFMSGSNLKSKEIEYAAQASESICFVKFDSNDDSSKDDVCRARIHPYNFDSIEEKLFVYFPSHKLKEIEKNFKLCGDSDYLADVEFEVKHFYFNSLHNAVLRIPDPMLDKLLPRHSSPAAQQDSTSIMKVDIATQDNSATQQVKPIKDDLGTKMESSTEEDPAENQDQTAKEDPLLTTTVDSVIKDKSITKGNQFSKKATKKDPLTEKVLLTGDYQSNTEVSGHQEAESGQFESEMLNRLLTDCSTTEKFVAIEDIVIEEDVVIEKHSAPRKRFSYKIEQFDWSKVSDGLSFLHLDYQSQFPALQRIVSCTSKVPFILSGPFGSGKTRVLACTAIYFASRRAYMYEPAKILICAHHQQSTETFINEYIGKLMQKRPNVKLQVVHIVRGKQGKRGRFSEFYKTIYEFKDWCKNGGYDSLKPIIVISTYINSLSLYEILHVPVFGFFTHLLLDEAAQVREPEAIAPLSLATPDAKIVLAGDHFQVGPNTLVLGQEAIKFDMNVSLLERLLKLYRSNSPVWDQYITQLNVIYRCHELLVSLPRKLFYGDSLKPGRRHKTIHCGPKGYLFVCSTSLPLARQSSVTEYEAEAVLLLEEVLSYTEKMKKEDKFFFPKQICIISTSRNQLNTIKQFIFKEGKYESIRKVKFLPSFALQGHEFKAIFLSLSGSLNDGKMYHNTKSLCNPIVFNTVITRAMTRVVAVGDPYELLEYESKCPDPIKPWHQYLKVCLEQDSVVTVNDIDEKAKLKELIQKYLK